MWPFSWFRKQREKHETVEEVYERRGVNIHESPPMPNPYARRQPRIESSHVPLRPAPTDSGGDFITGFLVGEALSGGNATAGLVGGAIGGVTGGIIGAELAPEPTTPPAQEFGGGESGGAGASGSWDAPADPAPSCSDTTTDSSSSDSSSSCDSSSSDSGSSGGDF